MRRLWLTLSVLCFAALSACGGSSGDDNYIELEGATHGLGTATLWPNEEGGFDLEVMGANVPVDAEGYWGNDGSGIAFGMEIITAGSSYEGTWSFPSSGGEGIYDLYGRHYNSSGTGYAELDFGTADSGSVTFSIDGATITIDAELKFTDAAPITARSRIVAMSFCEPRSWTRVLSS